MTAFSTDDAGHEQRAVLTAADGFGELTRQTPHRRVLALGGGGLLPELLRRGLVEEGSVVEPSPARLESVRLAAKTVGFGIRGTVGEWDELPFADGTFDAVVGLGALGRVRNVPAVLRETLRVLGPSGRFVFAGERTTLGSFTNRAADRLGAWLSTREPGESPADDVAELPVHPEGLERLVLRLGAVDVQARGEDLSAAWFGLPARTAEVVRGELGSWWEPFVRRSARHLSWVDRRVSGALPRELFGAVTLSGMQTHGLERL
ncbi:class I SAM-dependent methyltransferase [Allosaccharopolyspora coralli]|uniref:class I SAM-dependent methyltransferase n=1 Tax=Allosaccharopolyspora coralli TaxID=2665642 RepID=UPI0016526B02|nr:methyltransferase domain-containing protein [Allosaccharopolyspora coralli]